VVEKQQMTEQQPSVAPRTEQALAAFQAARKAYQGTPGYDTARFDAVWDGRRNLVAAVEAELPALLARLAAAEAVIERARAAWEYYSQQRQWPAYLATAPMEKLGDVLDAYEAARGGSDGSTE
jgi:hypothetical protein